MMALWTVLMTVAVILVALAAMTKDRGKSNAIVAIAMLLTLVSLLTAPLISPTNPSGATNATGSQK